MATRKTAAKKQPGLRVRMYRQGLGDCFLLTFPGAAGKPFHMLIDCGVVLGTADATAKMQAVVEDVIATTGGSIDLLVATHEHWDHVSGFGQAADLFLDEKKLQVKQVWLAWTEDPKDKLAAKLRAERRTAENALRIAAQRLALSGNAETAERVDSLVGFFGAKAGSTEEALDNVKKLAKGKPRYCEPGEPPIAIKDLPGVRFWVLGPPRIEKLIKKSNPGKGDAYGLDAGPGGGQAFLISALLRGADGVSDGLDEPFDAVYSIPMGRAEKLGFFQKHYFNEDWRRIDAAWMDSSEAMALQLDSATNNTSLVLAIELEATGEVLLFPGDAQAGNWLSWQDLAWDLEDPKTGKKSRVTGPDLLARTVFYKVGHHGSHNATLKALGLELMTHDGLMAMIPVDHDMAVKKRWGRMPLPDLVDRLMEKTHGRVLRVDDKVSKPADLLQRKPDKTSAEDWASFTGRVDVTDLFYDLRF